MHEQPVNHDSAACTMRTWVRVCRVALKQYGGGSIAERSIDDVGVAGDPPNISHTGKDVTRSVVKHVLQGRTMAAS